MGAEKRSTLTKNGASYSMSTILSMLIPLVVYLRIARVLGPEYFGKVSFVQTFSSYFIILATLGLPNYSQKVCANCGDDNEQLAKTTAEMLVIALVLTLVSLVAYAAMAISLFGERGDILLYATFAASVLAASLSMDWFIVARERFVYISIRNVLAKILFFIGSYCLVRTQNDYIRYAAICVLTGSLGFALTNYTYIVLNHMISMVPVKSLEIRRHLKPIFFLSLVTIGSKLFSSTDTFMLGLICGDVSVGIYSNAIKLPLVLDEILMAIAAVVTPQLYLSVSRGDEERIHYLMDYASNLMLFFAVPAVVLCMVMPEQLVLFLGGEEYVSGSPVLAIYSIIMITTLCITMAGTRMYIARGQEKQLFIILLVFAVINVILNAALIPRYAEMGSAIATVISNIGLLLVELSYAHTFQYLFKMEKSKYLIAGALLLFVLILIRSNVSAGAVSMIMLSVVLGGIVYIAALYAQGETTTVRAKSLIAAFIKRRLD